MHQETRLARISSALVPLAFLALTNRYLTYRQGVDILTTTDSKSYMKIALAAPQLPKATDLVDGRYQIPFHHAQRWIVHYLIGTFAYLSGIPLEWVYRAAIVACILLTVWAVSRCFDLLGLRSRSRLLLMSLIVLNPYFFRYFLTLHVMLQDLVAIMGMSWIFLGQFEKNRFRILVGLLVTTVGRQTSLFLLPPLLLWLIWWDGLNLGSLKSRTWWSTIYCVSVVAAYKFTGVVALRFSSPSISTALLPSLYYWFADYFSGTPHYFNHVLLPLFDRSMPGAFSPLAAAPTFRAFLEFIGRTFTPLAHSLGLLGLLLLGIIRRHERYPTDFLNMLLMASGVVIVPLLMGPYTASMSASRYGMPTVLPLVLACAALLGSSDLFEKIRPTAFYGVIGLIALASFHHVFSMIALTPASAIYFVIWYWSTGLLAIGILWLAIRASHRSVPIDSSVESQLARTPE